MRKLSSWVRIFVGSHIRSFGTILPKVDQNMWPETFLIHNDYRPILLAFETRASKRFWKNLNTLLVYTFIKLYSDVARYNIYNLLKSLGKRHYVRAFHYDLPEEMFVSICRHIKSIPGVRNDKSSEKAGCSEWKLVSRS